MNVSWKSQTLAHDFLQCHSAHQRNEKGTFAGYSVSQYNPRWPTQKPQGHGIRGETRDSEQRHSWSASEHAVAATSVTMYSSRRYTARPTSSCRSLLVAEGSVRLGDDVDSVPARQSVHFPLLDTTRTPCRRNNAARPVRAGMRPAYPGRQCEIQNVVNAVDERALGGRAFARCINPTYLAMIY